MSESQVKPQIESEVPETASTPVVLFDGVCNLCNHTVQFIIKRDPQARFRFASLQSTAGQSLLKKHSLSQETFDTFVLCQGDECLTKSDAALGVARQLTPLWRLLTLLRLVPRPLRNGVYDVIARNRYRWFGKKESCMVPTKDLRDRFLG